MLKLLLFLLISTVHSYSFCPKCVHFYITDPSMASKTKPNCNLFKENPLFKDRPDVDFIGKEICTEKGKYFKSLSEEKDTNDDEFVIAKCGVRPRGPQFIEQAEPPSSSCFRLRFLRR